MAVTNGDVALALGLAATADAALDAGVAEAIRRVRVLAVAQCEEYAPDAPVAVKEQAAITFAAYLYESRGRVNRPHNQFVASGAQAMLADWRSVSVTAATGAGSSVPAVPAPAEGGGLPAGGAAGNLLVRGAAAMSGLWRSLADVLRGRVGVDELDTAVTDTLNGAVQVESVELSGTDLVLSSGGGGSETVQLGPVVDGRIADQVPAASRVPASAGSDDADKVLKLDGDGANPAWRVDATGSGGGGGLDAAAVNAAIDARVPTARRVPAVPASGGADKVLKLDSAGRNPDWRADAEGSGGLDQAAVDARVDALVPPVRRVPSYSVGDVGEFLAVAPGGASLRFEPAPAGSGGSVTEQAVYDQAKAIVEGGSGIAVDLDDADRSITIRAAVKSGSKLPANPNVGDRFRLTAAATVQPFRTEYGVSIVPDPRVQYPVSSDADSVAYIMAFDLAYSAAALRNKVFIVTAGNYLGAQGPIRHDAVLHWAREGEPLVEYQIADTAVSSGYTHFFAVMGLSYADVSDTGYRYSYWFDGGELPPPGSPPATFTGGGGPAGNYPPAVQVDAGDLTYAGGQHGQAGWVPTPGVPAAWAVQGQPRPRVGLAVTPLIDGPGAGMTLTGFSGTVRNALSLFDPAFDLDDDDKQSGIVEVEATLTITARAYTAIGFGARTGSVVARITGFAFVSALRALDVYTSSGGATRGLKIGEWDIYAPVSPGTGSVGLLAGGISLFLARNANKELGYHLTFQPGDEAVVGNATFGLRLSAAFLHNDESAPSGLNQAAVDARVNALVPALVDQRVPAVRRVPAVPSSGGANRVLKLDGSGANPAWRPDATGSGGGGSSEWSGNVVLTRNNAAVFSNLVIPSTGISLIWFDFTSDADPPIVISNALLRSKSATSVGSSSLSNAVPVHAFYGSSLTSFRMYFGRTATNQYVVTSSLRGNRGVRVVVLP